MKEGKVISSDILRITVQMGHFGKLGIGNAGIPVPFNTGKIDLAVSNGLSSSLSVLEDVLEELEIRSIKLAEEVKIMNLEILEKIKLLLPDTPISFIPHKEMREELNNRHALIRTGETTPYANIILVNGVVF